LDTVDLTNFLLPASVTIEVKQHIAPVVFTFAEEMRGRGEKAIRAVLESTKETDPTRLTKMVEDLRALAGSGAVADLIAQAGHTLSSMTDDLIDNFVTELVALSVYVRQEFDERRTTNDGTLVLATHYANHLKVVAEALQTCATLMNAPLGTGKADKQSVRTLDISESILSQPVEVTAFLHSLCDIEGELEQVAVRANISLLPVHLADLNASMAKAMQQQADLLARDQGEKNLGWLGFSVTRFDAFFRKWFGDDLDKPHAELRNRSIAVLGNALRGGSDGTSRWITLDQVRRTRGNLKRPQKTTSRTASDCGGSMDG